MSAMSRFITSIKDSFRSHKEDASGTNLQTIESPMLKLKIAANFGVAIVKVSKSIEIHFVKALALELISQSPGFSIFPSHPSVIRDIVQRFQLFRTKTKCSVRDFDVLSDLDVQNDEEFLLIPRRSPVWDGPRRGNFMGPSERHIMEKTALIKKTKPQFPAFDTHDILLEDDMRKVFVTLAQESAYMLGATPLADKLIAYYRERIRNYIKHHKNAVKVLVQLGFPMDRVKHAMKLRANNARAALDWLIDNEESTGYDENLAVESPRTSLTRRFSSATSARRNSILSTSFVQVTTISDRIDGLLEIVKFYAEKDELIYDENIEEMVSMGFEEQAAREALGITRNNIGAAVAYIHGDENPSITELRDGLSESSNIRKKILESTEIQESLNKPQFFELYINILDNPWQANAWNPWTDVGALMTHLIVTYHDQKHVAATNQFNESRMPISALSAPN